MKEIDGVKYVTKEDIIKASVKVTRKITDEAPDPMFGLMVVMVAGELTSELFPKEDKENKEE